MKKFSIFTALLAASLPMAAAHAAGTQATVAQAQTVASRSQCTFLANAPDQHVVVSGDTLWGISAVFLSNPWCWPQVWGMNKQEIHNPHWIYPGQIVYFDRSNQRLRLANPGGSLNGAGATPTVKLVPGSRVQGLGANAIPSIPASVIEPFLSQPMVVEQHTLDSSPRIVAAQEGRVNMGTGEIVYVRGDLDDNTSFQVFRPGRPLKDPDTGNVIGFEAAFVGTIKLERTASDGNDVYTFKVVNAKEEISVGDRMIPLKPIPIISYVPHPAEPDMRARIVSVYGGVDSAGQNQIVTINRGSEHGIDLGTVLTLQSAGSVIRDRTDGNRSVRLPDEKYGDVFIFRVFDNVSYGLVMQVRNVVKVGDVARSPLQSQDN